MPNQPNLVVLMATEDGPVGPSNPIPTAGTAPSTPSLTPTISSKATSNSSVTLLAANTDRQSASFYNAETDADLYLNEAGGTATTAIGGYTACLKRNGGYYELPIGANGGVVKNAITGIWSATGSLGCAITERE